MLLPDRVSFIFSRIILFLRLRRQACRVIKLITWRSIGAAYHLAQHITCQQHEKRDGYFRQQRAVSCSLYKIGIELPCKNKLLLGGPVAQRV